MPVEMGVLDAVGEKDRILLSMKTAARVQDARIEDDAVASIGSDPFGVAPEKIQPAQSGQHVCRRARAALNPAPLLRVEPSRAVTACDESEAELTGVVALKVDTDARDA